MIVTKEQIQNTIADLVRHEEIEEIINKKVDVVSRNGLSQS